MATAFGRCAGSSSRLVRSQARVSGGRGIARLPHGGCARRRGPGNGGGSREPAVARRQVAAGYRERGRIAGDAVAVAARRPACAAAGTVQPLDERVASAVMVLVALVTLVATAIWTARPPL